jgi:hypothetical protein
VLLEDDSAINIISYELVAQMGTSPLRLTLVKTSLIRIEGLGVSTKSTLEIQVTISTPSKCVSLQQNFMIIDMPLVYNVIRGMPLLY